MEQKVLHDRYELEEQIGQGGMGSVYRALDLHLQRYVAIKKIMGEDDSGMKADSLMNEVQILKQLKHPALPVIYDHFRENNKDYLVLEYIQGITLKDYVTNRGPLEQPQAVTIAIGLAELFAFLHSHKPPIIYRDLKPSNVMLQDNGSIRLIDFGTAVFSYYRQGCPIEAGTPGFSAPELLMPGRDIRKSKEKCDIYSLGAILHYLLTGIDPGIPPYKPYPVREYNGALSAGLEKVIDDCTRESSSERYGSMYQVMQELKDFQKNEKDNLWKKSIYRAIYVILMVIGILLFLSQAVKGIPLPVIFCDTGLVFDREYTIPDDILQSILFVLAGLAWKKLLLSGDRKRYLRKQEKSIFLTQKKSIGLWSWSILCILAVAGTLYTGEKAYAEEKGDLLLPVTIRDSLGRKILIKDDAVYKPQSDMILELPLSGIPAGEEFILQISISGANERYESREFVIYNIP